MKKRIIDYRTKEKFQIDDAYLNGYASLVGWKGTLVYLSLCRHANKDQEAFPSISLMSNELNVSERSIIRGIQDLTEWNIISIDDQLRGKNGAWKNNFYGLLDKSCWKKKPSPGDCESPGAVCHTVTRPGDSQSLDGVTHSHTKDTHVKDTHKEGLPPIAPQGGAVEITDQTNEDSQPRKEVETSNQSLDGNSSLVGVALVEPAVQPETGVADLSTNHQLEESKKMGKAVNDVLAVFYKKNPHIPFGKPSERKAAEDVITIHGIEDTIKIAEYAISLNSTPYAPVINSATQLKAKLPALKAYFDRTKAIEAQKEERAKLIFGKSYDKVKETFKLMDQNK